VKTLSTQATTQQRLAEIISNFENCRVLIIGDAIADRFVYGNISRVSREAPVFILRHEHTETLPGGAANCAVNVATLGAEVSLLSVTGNDEPGQQLRSKLVSAGVNTASLLVSDNWRTTTKERILAGQAHSTKQQVIRIDYEGSQLENEGLRKSIAETLNANIANCDVVIISDYNYGVVDDNVIASIRKHASVNSLPVLVDSRFRLSSFTDFTAATPNEDELEQLIGEAIQDQEHLENSAGQLNKALNTEALLVTRGGQGMMLIQRNQQPLHIAAVGADQPVDVTGAGDTVITTFALAIASKASFLEAASLANYAGGLVVMKRGTASVSADELRDSILSEAEG
jgi:rfaE bifunctional protein kinase chain/domain